MSRSDDDVRGMMTDSLWPGKNTSSSRFASPTTGNLPYTSTRRSDSTALESWPLPPSMITRSGHGPFSSKSRA